MNASQKKVVQYLGEAHASEQALDARLQSQIAMTPRGANPTALEQHLRRRATTPSCRRAPAGAGAWRVPLTAAFDSRGRPSSLRRWLFTKTPFYLLRGSGGAEKVLKNAKDANASEAHGIATYTAISVWPGAVGRRGRRPGRLRRSSPTSRRCSSGPDSRSPSSPTPLCAPTSRATRRTTSPRWAPPTRSATPARPQGRGADDDRPRQAHGAPGPQGAGRRPGRRPDQGRRRVRGRPRDRPLRRADRGGDRQQAGRPLPDRPGQDRLLRAQEPEPQARSSAGSPRCAAASRGPATTS